MPDKDTIVLKSKRTVTPLSVLPSEEAQEISIYPNPVENGTITVEISEAARIRILQTDGSIKSERYEEAGKMMIEHLSSGVYYVEITTRNVRKTQKIWVK